MNTSRYEQRGFEGVDASLEISLKEYGLIWKEYKINTKNWKKGEHLFIFGTEFCEEKQEYAGTAYGYYIKENLLREGWIEWGRVSNYYGMTVDQFKELPLGLMMFDLVNYYGAENFY